VTPDGFSDAEVTALREVTPGTANVLHFNNAGAGLMSQGVLDALTAHLELEAQIGGYEAAAARATERNLAYDAIATYLNCRADEIALVENATVAWNQAFFAVLETLQPGDRILTVEAEYASNYLTYLMARETRGIVIDVAPVTEAGETDVAAMANLVGPRTRLIAATHIPTNGGLVNPAEAIGRIARQADITYLLDACQSVGQRALDVEKIGCDFLSATGRKYLRGPRGTGFLYASQRALERYKPPTIDLHAAAWDRVDGYSWAKGAARFENWEYYEAGRIGLAVAVDEMLAIGVERIETRTTALAAELRDRLTALPGFAVHDLGPTRCGIVTFTHPRLEAVQVQAALSAQQINVSTSSAASTRLDMQKRGLPTLVRASVHYYNDQQELDRFIAAVDHLGR